MDERVGGHPIFGAWSQKSFNWGPGDQWSGSLGGDVMAAVTAGLDEFLGSGRWRSPRRQPAVLGCSPWLTDRDTVDRLLAFGASCIVINKPGQVRVESGEVTRLHDEGPGFPAEALPDFMWLAPRGEGGQPVLGPFDDSPRAPFRSVRVAGISRQDGTVPLVHAKLLLLGEITESEGEFGEPVVYFTPSRLWAGSANLTRNSRRSLEFGLWTDDPSLLSRMTSFLTDLLKYSELLAGFAAGPQPERVPYEFDDAAMYDYLRELGEHGQAMH